MRCCRAACMTFRRCRHSQARVAVGGVRAAVAGCLCQAVCATLCLLLACWLPNYRLRVCACLSLLSARQDPPFEGNIEVRRGHVCFIPGGKDFFIALGDHPEWGKSHPVRYRCVLLRTAA
jgi:hypothetical protein